MHARCSGCQQPGTLTLTRVRARDIHKNMFQGSTARCWWCRRRTERLCAYAAARTGGALRVRFHWVGGIYSYGPWPPRPRGQRRQFQFHAVSLRPVTKLASRLLHTVYTQGRGAVGLAMGLAGCDRPVRGRGRGRRAASGRCCSVPAYPRPDGAGPRARVRLTGRDASLWSAVLASISVGCCRWIWWRSACMRACAWVVVGSLRWWRLVGCMGCVSAVATPELETTLQLREAMLSVLTIVEHTPVAIDSSDHSTAKCSGQIPTGV